MRPPVVQVVRYGRTFGLDGLPTFPAIPPNCLRKNPEVGGAADLWQLGQTRTHNMKSATVIGPGIPAVMVS